jgi:hypothetical protein
METTGSTTFKSRYPLLSILSNWYREQRLQEFIKRMNISGTTTILDIGGFPYFWKDLPCKCQVVCLNIEEEHSDETENVRLELYDGGTIPYGNKYCNCSA